MAKRSFITDRLIPVLGVTALIVGLGVVWFTTRGASLSPPEAPAARAMRQLREHDPRLVAQYVEPGVTAEVVCGYSGADEVPQAGEAPIRGGGKFISRPMRMLFDTDPLTSEFAEQFARECPSFPIGPPVVVHDRSGWPLER